MATGKLKEKRLVKGSQRRSEPEGSVEWGHRKKRYKMVGLFKGGERKPTVDVEKSYAGKERTLEIP